jgi:excisionase family DNA binding protein
MEAIQFIQVTPEELSAIVLKGVKEIFSSLAVKTEDSDELWTKKQAAEYLKVTIRTVDNLVKNKKLGLYGFDGSVRLKKSECLALPKKIN